ncbi:unannotated protein [freshwater metagenome]|uniref:Unannotated protein n=1 Tax=freshwater metagenome TaxID=449393 RepID=A0A6J7HKK5_9ZZZZ
MSPRCATAVAHDRSSRRIFAKVRSPSLRSSRSGCFTPTSASIAVVAPEISTSRRSRSTRRPAFRSYSPMPKRCERNVGVMPTGELGGSCSMTTLVKFPAASRLTNGRSRLTPLVRSHSSVHDERSRPDVASSSTSKSGSCVFFHACFTKYCCKPAKNSASPTHATN